MSIQTVARVLELDVEAIPRPADSPTWPMLKLVLLGLANHADREDRDAYPAVSTLARYAAMNERTVRRCLRALEEIGLIRRGNQTIVAAKIERHDRRPTNYDLDLRGGGDDNGGADSPPVGGNGGAVSPERGGTPPPEPS